jgi:RNA polymerase sigma factor (sigma-70 family)
LSSEPVSEDPTELIDGVLLAAIRTLSQRQREVVALRLLLDLDTESTARQLGIAPGTVTAQLHRAVTHLREALTNYTGGVG